MTAPTTPRPIGTEFEVCFPPLRSSAAQDFIVFRYRVVKHSAVIHAGTVELAETVEVVGDRRYAPVEFRIWCGQLMPVPPPECVGLLDDGWRALAGL